jgi:predicted ATP-grasp superfamily ATP-dependent carboligase
VTAIVCNCYFNGLSIVQQLGRRGIDVHALDAVRNVGTVSRYGQFRRCPNPIDSEEAFVAYLETIATEFDDRPVLIPTNDHWASAVARHRDRLAEAYRPCVASGSVVELLLHKGRFYEWASEREYPVPETWRATEHTAVPSSAFPIVAKPDVRRISSDDPDNRETVERMNERRLTLLEDPPALHRFTESHADILERFVLQEYVRGRSDRMYTVGLYADREHTVLGRFEGRKIRGYPPGSGDCRVGQVERVPDRLVEIADRLVADLGYSGIAEVEFKRDSETGAFRLIEVNPRSWSWIGITDRCGVGLPWLAYADLAGDVDTPVSDPPVTQSVPDGSVKWVKPLDDLANCLYFNAARGHEDWTLSLEEWWESLDARELVIAGLSADDPVPAAFAGGLEGHRLVAAGLGGLRRRFETATALLAWLVR